MKKTVVFSNFFIINALLCTSIALSVPGAVSAAYPANPDETGIIVIDNGQKTNYVYDRITIHTPVDLKPSNPWDRVDFLVTVNGADSELTAAEGTTYTLISTTADNYASYGVNGIIADNGAIVNLDKTNITVQNVGIIARNGSKISIGDDSNIYALGKDSGNAVHVMKNSEITIGDRATLISTTSNNRQSTVYITNGGRITIGDYAHIVNDATGSQTDLYGNTTTPSKQTEHHAVSVFGNGEIIIGDNSTIEVISNLTNGSQWPLTGLWVGQGSYDEAEPSIIRTGNNTTINISGGDAYGAIALTYGEIHMGDDTVINIDGKDSLGIEAVFGTSITLGNSSEVHTKQDNSYAIMSYGVHTVIEVDQVKQIDRYSNVVIGDDLMVTTEGVDSVGLYAMIGAEINVGENANIHTKSQGAYAILANRPDVYTEYPEIDKVAEVNLGKNATITAEKSDAVVAANGGKVTLKGGTITADMTEDYDALYAFNQKNQAGDIVYKDISRINAEGVFTINGSIRASNYGKINLTMQGDKRSELNGYTAIVPDAIEAEINMVMENAQWNITDNSRLTSLAMDGTKWAVVDFGASDFGTTLTMDKLNHLRNSGAFVMRADMAEETSDKVIINDVAANGNSNHYIFVSDYDTPDSTATVDGNEKVTLIQVNGDNKDKVNFKLVNLTGQTTELVDLKGLQYELINEPAEQSILATEPQNNWNLKGANKASTDSSAAINTFAGGYLLNYAETQTLIQRLGDLRESQTNKGAWARMYGGKYESSANSFLSGFDMNYNGVQIGYDKKLKSSEKGDFYLGGMFGYSQGDLNYDRGRGKVDAKTLGIYGTYIQKDGFYTDVILKYMWMKNDFQIINLQGEGIKGDKINTGGLGTSIEIGKRYHKDKENKTGFYVEPQMQLSYGQQDGGTFKTSNGNIVTVDSYNSLMGRIGMMIGYENEKKDKNIYAKISWVKEINGDLGININGTNIEESFGDNWWVYGIGFTSKVGKNSSIYLDIERSTGGQFREPWAIKGGFRYSF